MQWQKQRGDQIESYEQFEQTLSNGWSKEGGIDKQVWTNTDFWWRRETIINEEDQYYPSEEEVAEYGLPAPWRVAPNGNLLLETHPIPKVLVGKPVLLGVVNNYPFVTSALESIAGSNLLRLKAPNLNVERISKGGWVLVRLENGKDQRFEFTKVAQFGEFVQLQLTDVLPMGLDSSRSAQIALQQPFVSGLLTTHEGFTQVRGRFEIRCKFPNGRGCFPAFWMLSKRTHDHRDYPHSTEFDIIENLGHDPYVLYQTWHSPQTIINPKAARYGRNMLQHIEYTRNTDNETDFSHDFHTFTLDWTPDGWLIWAIDGVVSSVQPLAGIDGANVDKSQFDIEKEKFLLLNLAYGSKWSEDQQRNDASNGRPGTEVEFPAQFEIEHVRVYQYKDSAVPSQSNTTRQRSTSNAEPETSRSTRQQAAPEPEPKPTPKSRASAGDKGVTKIQVLQQGRGRMVAGTSQNLSGRSLWLDMKNGKGYPIPVDANGAWQFAVPEVEDTQQGVSVNVYGQAADGSTDSVSFNYQF